MKKLFGGLYKRKTVSGILFSLGQAVYLSPHLFRYSQTRSIITGRIYPFTGCQLFNWLTRVICDKFNLPISEYGTY
jgi:hypothetical protein